MVPDECPGCGSRTLDRYPTGRCPRCHEDLLRRKWRNQAEVQLRVDGYYLRSDPRRKKEDRKTFNYPKKRKPSDEA